MSDPLAAIRSHMAKDETEQALQLLDHCHVTLHDQLWLHEQIHWLWLKCLFKHHNGRPPLGALAFQLLALTFAMPVSVIEKLTRKIKTLTSA